MLRGDLVPKRWLFVIALAVAACGSDAAGGDETTPEVRAPGEPTAVIVQVGTDVPAGVRERIEGHVLALAPSARIAAPDEVLHDLAPGTLVVGAGTTWASSQAIADDEVAALPDEGYVLASKPIDGAVVVAAKGKPGTRLPHGNVGNAYGAYAILEEMGLGFLHPLAPTLPKHLVTPPAGLARKEAPRWPVRGLQLHTMHPLELTHLLEGWGPGGPNDAAGWEAMLPEWDRFLEWTIANGQNRVHWRLLEADSWKDFAESGVRQERLEDAARQARPRRRTARSIRSSATWKRSSRTSTASGRPRAGAWRRPRRTPSISSTTCATRCTSPRSARGRCTASTTTSTAVTTPTPRSA